MRIEHVFFDLDHTLWDFEKNSALAFKKILPEAGVSLEFDNFMKAYSPINVGYWKLYREEKISKKNLRYSRLKDTFDALEYSIDDDLIYHLSEEYILQLPNFNHLFEGTTELLEYLKEKYALHIITNGFEEVQTIKMQKSGIIDYFKEIITSESVGVKKPNPRVFNYAIEKTNAVAANSMMIGDNLEADIQGAINCGMNVIHYNSENLDNIPQNVTSVNHLLEIKQYL
ncbi:YjjG family noncanonical pyrimidine nucleotidase [Pseudotenacibaculum sp. MALMAid0570]|uniref:YjjG family noncanonical pyrimidine nucleotidase n=1 Tax=Pseudotenacibaculum sp. MALMAid0570 TaxID=3143938 RepID=UPI0032DE93CF